MGCNVNTNGGVGSQLRCLHAERTLISQHSTALLFAGRSVCPECANTAARRTPPHWQAVKRRRGMLIPRARSKTREETQQQLEIHVTTSAESYMQFARKNQGNISAYKLTLAFVPPQKVLAVVSVFRGLAGRGAGSSALGWLRCPRALVGPPPPRPASLKSHLPVVFFFPRPRPGAGRVMHPSESGNTVGES